MNVELMADSIRFKPSDKKLWLKYKTAKRTLDVLIEHCDTDGETFIGIKTIAQRLLVSNQTVMNHFEALKEIGVLEISQVGNKSYKKISFGSKDGSTLSSKEGSKDGSTLSSKEGSSPLEQKEVIEGKEGNVAPPLISDEALDVANYLYGRITSEKPNFKKPNLETWAKDIDKAIRIDKRSHEELIDAIDWIYSSAGEFWQPNIMSGKKLREKFDILEAQAIRSAR